MSEETKVLACPDCNIQVMTGEKKKFITVQVVIGVLLFLTGLVSLLFNAIVGLLMIAIGIIVGSIGRKFTQMVCPK